jgi:hypothetical protein
LAEGTTHSYQNDQVLRGIRTLLAVTGHVQAHRLFAIPRRKPIWLALLAYKPESLVDRYRDRDSLAGNLKDLVAENDLPADPFVGTITWLEIAQILNDRQSQMTPAERSITGQLDRYIQHKMVLPRKTRLPILESNADNSDLCRS